MLRRPFPPGPNTSHGHYFSLGAGYPWAWAENRSVLVWKPTGDGTIAFLPEIEAMLRRLSPRGWPAFGPMALVLAACRGWVVAVPDSPVAVIAEATAALEALSRQLPAETLRSVEGRGFLLEILAQDLPVAIRPEHTLTRLEDWMVGADYPTPVGNTLHEDLAALAPALRALTPEKLASLAATGLHSLPEPARVPLPAGDADDLGDDPAWQPFFRLARHVTAVLPRPSPGPESAELADGGWSGITNRGSPDRLLLTELAADEDLFTVRLTRGEALYRRREPPRRPPPQEVHAFLDTSLHQWGRSRIIGAAVIAGMAAALPAQAGGFHAWLRRDGTLETADPTTREGLTALLTGLDPAPSPAAAVAAFHARCPAGRGQRVIVTSWEAGSQPDWRDLLQSTGPWRLARTARDGRFLLEEATARGWRLLHQATLPVESLLSPLDA